MIRLTRTARGWGQLGLQAALLVCALGLVQVVADRTNRRVDLTPGREMTLAPVTRQILAEVRAPLRVTVFHRRGERAPHLDLLRRFRRFAPALEFELLDLDRHPDRARALGVTGYGRAAVEYEGRRTVAPALPEEELAGAILHVVRGRARRIAFTTGHGERPPGGGDDGLGRLAAALAAENFTTDTVSLLEGPVPDGTDVVVVAGPRQDFAPRELDELTGHLERGRAVLLLLDPEPLPNVTRFLAGMGVRLGDDFVVDRARRVLGTDGLAAVVELFKRGNPISDAPGNPIESGVVLPSARTVDVVAPVPGVAAESIARTSPSAWTVADPARARRGDEPSRAKRDVPGSASVAVVAEVGQDPRGRLVVVGDADFASDAYLDLLGNRDFAMNAVGWLAGEERLVGRRKNEVPEILRPLSPLVLTEPQSRAIFVAVTVVEPGLVLLAGLVVVGIRRRRG